ncbi:MAG: hypothetical protein DHS20C15_10890 [Planctomycetota bacterium]|nr:MAG: hypothetical protein DHS20C15_10890 [Planctomycetota bacterium]
MNARPAFVALLLSAIVAPLQAQALTSDARHVDRFAGWDRVTDDAFVFDPDDREVMGFRVRTSSAARSAFDGVNAAFEAGDALTAGHALLAILREYDQQVVQVAAGTRSARWIGAGEWAVYQLQRRVPASVRAQLASPEDRAVLEQAVAWRDEPVLRRLAIELEALPEGERARGALARLLREAGHAAEALVVERRSLPAPPEPVSRLPQQVSESWSRPLGIDRVTARSSRAINPLAGRPASIEAPYAAVRPVVRDGVVYVSDTLSLRAFDLVSGREHWAALGPLEENLFGDSSRDIFEYSVYAERRRPRAINPFQVAQPTVAGERVFNSVQVGEAVHPLDSFDSVPINYPLPRRRLRAHDRATGRLLWTQERPELDDEAFENRFDAVGPPVVVGDRVWVSGVVREGALSAWVVAFDVQTGALRSRTLLCTGQQELTMFNRPFHEHLVSPVREHEGSLYVSTNLGVVGCVDAFSGRPRWLAGYEIIKREGAVRMRSESRLVHWMNEPPAVLGDTVLLAPLDSEWLLGLEASTGRTRHLTNTELSRRSGHRSLLRHQVLSLDEQRVLILSRRGVECREARSGDLLWTHKPFRPDDYVVGRAVLHDGELLVPCETELLVVDPEDGSLLRSLGWPGSRRGADMQVVKVADDVLLMTDGGALHALIDTAQMRASLPSVASGEPESRRRVAELALLTRDYDQAYRAFDALARELDVAGGEARAARVAGVSDGARALHERVVRGRLEAAVLRAQTAPEPAGEAWVAALDACVRPDLLLSRGPQILDGLARADRDVEVLRGLEQLLPLAPDIELALGGEPVQPVSVLRARFSLAQLDPAGQLALLQELIDVAPDGLWGSRSVAGEAARRQRELLDAHGEQLYTVQERSANLALEGGASLDAVERRYPHARVVAEARRRELVQLLESGHAARVLPRTAAAADAATRALRLAAAEQLGEHGYAALLRGEPSAPHTSPRRLPDDASGTRTLQLHQRHDVRFRPVTGQPSPQLAGMAPGFIDGVGTLFVIDTQAGELAWSGRRLPGGQSRLPHDASFHIDGELLVLRGGNVVEALELANGHSRWEAYIEGVAVESLAGAGLFLTLLQSSGDQMELVALGLRSGAQAFSITLEDARDANMRRAGRYLVLAVDAARDQPGVGRVSRLLVVDLADGRVLHHLPLGGDLSLYGSFDDPALVMFSGRMGTSSRLLGFDPARGEWLWDSEVESPSLSRDALLSDGARQRVLASHVRLPGSRTRSSELHRIDPALGLQPPAALPLMQLVDGQDENHASEILLQDLDVAERFLVVSAADLSAQHELRFLPGELSTRPEVLRADDGFVLMSQTSGAPPRTTSIWVVSGAERTQRYSVDPGETSRVQLPRLMLVDGALLIAAGSSVRIVRSNTR